MPAEGPLPSSQKSTSLLHTF